MRKLSILKKELFYNLGIGIETLILGIIEYVNIPNVASLIITILCIPIALMAAIPFFAETDSEDELSEQIKNKAGQKALRIGLLGLIILASFLCFNNISEVIVKRGIVHLIIAYFYILYIIIYVIETKRIEKLDGNE